MFSERRSTSGYETSFLADEAMMAKVAETIIKHKTEERPNEKDFGDIFQPDEIKKDRQMVDTMKENFDAQLLHLSESEVKKIKERENIGEAMEIAITDGIEMHDWFGENAFVTRTTEYDDIFNGVDAVVEFTNEEDDNAEHLALVVDVTTTNNFDIMRKKISKNIESLTGKDKKRKKVKYFKSPTTEEKQSLDVIIPVVMSLDSYNSQKLLEKFSQIQKLGGKEGKNQNDRNLIKDLKRELAEHPAQMIFLKEISLQLEHYNEIINLDKKTQLEIQNILTIIYGIIEEKGELSNEEMEEKDKSFRHLKEVLDTLK